VGVDRAIAAAKLASRGIHLDAPTPEQADTLTSLLDVDVLPRDSGR
jgi:hypothetical protein